MTGEKRKAIESLNLANLGGDGDGRDGQILTAYNALRAFESDYDKAQGQLRTIASAWLLAGVGAGGFLINAELANSWDHYAAALARQIVVFVVAFGVSALWRLDQKVYQQLLHTVFALGYRIEMEYPCVPPTRQALYELNRDITGELGHFYVRPLQLIFIAGLINVVAVALLFYASFSRTARINPTEAGAAFVLCVSIVALHYLYWESIKKESHGWGALEQHVTPKR
jgi:hypothetical protein